MCDSTTSPPLFALIIGINEYKSKSAWLSTLKGAVADADAVQHYLEEQLNVDSSHIQNLRDAQATGVKIISELVALQTDERIKFGDPILIYFAGHGGEANPPVGWEAGGGNSNIQMVIPHDYEPNADSGSKVHGGIPDYFIGVLINRLAKAKGDNIVRPNGLVNFIF
jgi:hypothetical protein